MKFQSYSKSRPILVPNNELRPQETILSVIIRFVSTLFSSHVVYALFPKVSLKEVNIPILFIIPDLFWNYWHWNFQNPIQFAKPNQWVFPGWLLLNFSFDLKQDLDIKHFSK